MVVLFVVTPWACETACGGYLYGIGGDIDIFPPFFTYLYQIDPTDGSYNTVAAAPPFAGLAYNSSDGYLYSIGEYESMYETFTGLFKIDLTDGSYDLVSNVPDIYEPEGVAGLAYNSIDGYLYGVKVGFLIGDKSDLFRVDPTDGSYELILNDIVPEAIAGLTYNTSDGYLYGTSLNNLYRIDPTDGSYGLVSGSSVSEIGGLAYNSSNGYLYGTKSRFDNDLYRIDPDDGSYVMVSQNSAPSITGLAYVPEPATLLFLGLGVAVLRKRR